MVSFPPISRILYQFINLLLFWVVIRFLQSLFFYLIILCSLFSLRLLLDVNRQIHRLVARMDNQLVVVLCR